MNIQPGLLKVQRECAGKKKNWQESEKKQTDLVTFAAATN